MNWPAASEQAPRASGHASRLQHSICFSHSIPISRPSLSPQAFRETVTATSDHVVMSKSPNKHNRLYMQVRCWLEVVRL